MPYRDLPEEDRMPPVFREWMQWLLLQENKPDHTLRAYSQGVRRILSFAKNEYESPLVPEDFAPDFLTQGSLTDAVRSMLAERKTDRAGEKVPAVSRQTINQSLAALKSFYDFCVQDGLVVSTPSVAQLRKVAKLGIEPQQTDPEYYPPNEIRLLYQTALNPHPEYGKGVRWPTRDIAMCSFLAVLGLRANELITADTGWIQEDVLLDKNSPDSMDDDVIWSMRVVGKRGMRRRLPLSGQLMEVWDLWEQERVARFGTSSPDDPLFITKTGDRFNYRRLRYWLLVLNREAALGNRSLHALRHTAGIQLAFDGIAANRIQNFLGHTSIGTTGIYTDMAGRDIKHLVRNSSSNRNLHTVLEGIDPWEQERVEAQKRA